MSGFKEVSELKYKSLLGLFILGVLVVVLAACGRTTELGDGSYETPHDLNLGFENCLVCHIGGLYAMPDDPVHDVPIELCATPACHPVAGTVPTTTTTTTPPTTTTEPTDTSTTGPVVEPPIMTAAGHDAYAAAGLCLICHGVGTGEDEFPIEGPDDHTGRTEDICLDCHKLPEE